MNTNLPNLNILCQSVDDRVGFNAGTLIYDEEKSVYIVDLPSEYRIFALQLLDGVLTGAYADLM